ncbi:unnamed protein product [Oreochromis niloticus]|nr:unnamed protein product [Mustela putorius furo]
MDEFRGIQMFLCLMLMIQIAVSETETSIFMKVGDDVTLLCLNVIDEQNNCDGTEWTFTSRHKTTVELITLGQIGEEAKIKSDRLSVTANCSLVIKNLTFEEVGLYSCLQYKLGEIQTLNTLVHQSQVNLFIISLTEHMGTDEVILNCSVVTYGQCHHTVNWLLKGQDVNKDNKEILTSQTDCSTTVTFWKSHYIYPSRYENMKCEVTDAKTGSVQLFTFSYQSSDEETDDKKTTQKPTRKTERYRKETETTTTPMKDDSHDFSVSSRFIIVSAGLATLLITAVTVNIWSRTKGQKTQMDQTTVHYDKDEDDVSINYESIGGSGVSVRYH